MKNVAFVHEQIASELQARRMGLMNERATLQKAAERLAEIDGLITALDVEIERSTQLIAQNSVEAGPAEEASK